MRISSCKPQGEQCNPWRELLFPAHSLSIHSRYVCLQPLADSHLTHPPYHKVKYVPEWFPGAGFKIFAREAKALFDLAVDGPLEYMKQSLEVGRPFHAFSMLGLIFVGTSLMGTMCLSLQPVPIG